MYFDGRFIDTTNLDLFNESHEANLQADNRELT